MMEIELQYFRRYAEDNKREEIRNRVGKDKEKIKAVRKFSFFPIIKLGEDGEEIRKR